MPFLKQLLILGNGFDLHCGLKSSYKDFFHSIIFDNVSERNGIMQMKIDNPGFWEALLLEYYKANIYTNYKWCDIEEIIKNTLLLIFYGDDNFSESIENGLWYLALDSMLTGCNLYNKKIINQTSIKKYIFDVCIKYFKIACYDIKNFNKDLLFEKLHSFSSSLLKDLKKLENRFCQYLKNRIVNSDYTFEINVNYIIKSADLLAKITGCSVQKLWNHQWVKNLNINSEIEWGNSFNLSKYLDLSNTYILNFNYTALFDLLKIQSPCVYNNVHGKLCNKYCEHNCEGSNIIFGIDDRVIQAHNANSELRLFSKTYRKMSDTSSPANILPANDGTPIVIKFYGHSLSEADYSYFQSIFDYYNLYGNSNIRLMFYYSTGFEQNDKIYKLINSYGQTLSNQDQGKNLMHKLLLENRLKIVEIP